MKCIPSYFILNRLYIHDNQAFIGGLVEAFGQFTDVRSAVVGVYARGVGRVNEEAEARAGAAGGP